MQEGLQKFWKKRRGRFGRAGLKKTLQARTGSLSCREYHRVAGF